VRAAMPPLPQHVFTTWCLIKQQILLHGVMLSQAQGQLHLPLTTGEHVGPA